MERGKGGKAESRFVRPSSDGGRRARGELLDRNGFCIMRDAIAAAPGDIGGLDGHAGGSAEGAETAERAGDPIRGGKLAGESGRRKGRSGGGWLAKPGGAHSREHSQSETSAVGRADSLAATGSMRGVG